MKAAQDPCESCSEATDCKRPAPVTGRVVCARYLTRAVAPASLTATLDSLKRAGAIDGYELAGGLVYLEGDMTALELAVGSLDEAVHPVRWVDEEDIVQRGYTESSVLTGSRGSSTARAADFEAVRTYYHEASAVLVRDRTLTRRARRIWALHADGESERKIAEVLGISVRKVRAQLEVIRQKAGLSRRKA